jgi:plasmid segregation actin-type ATPase ParM
VFLAVGLPLTWVSEQKDSFKAYLLRNKEVSFSFRGKSYRVTFAGAAVFPQGFSAVADRLREFRGVNMLCDIGNGTMNVMYINNGKPVSSRCYTEKFGTQQCMIAVREKLMQRFGVAVDETVIETVLRFRDADIGKQYLDVIRESAAEYVAGIMRRLREHEYNPELMRLYVVGGGSCLIKNFAEYDPERVTINDDICATAKGYELLAAGSIGRTGGV